MNSSKLYILALCLVFATSAPVDPVKKTSAPTTGDETKEDHKMKEELEDLGLEYGRYLQEVVAALEEDKDFAKKLENVSADHIRSGAIAKELNFVNHNVRTKLDELKRIEIERLRKLTKKEHDLKEGQGSYSQDGRRWRTVGGGNVEDSKHLSKFEHIDHSNPHSFEAQDLHNLILTATKDLEILDKKRREEFKQYEMEKELQYKESLKSLNETERKEAETKHDQLMQKHKDHPRVHHPGSKQQLEEVWEEKDHMPKEEFNPKVFFSMHDVNGDGYLDPEEVEAVLSLEIRKMYDPNNPEDDQNEMMEEYHRMREHIYKEADSNRDGLISKKEFLELTQRQNFEKDEGWRGLDEEKVYTDEEMREYEQHRQQVLAQQYGYYPVNGGYQPPNPQHYGYETGPSQGGYQQHPDQQHYGYQNVPPQVHQQQGGGAQYQQPHGIQQGGYQQYPPQGGPGYHPQQGGQPPQQGAPGGYHPQQGGHPPQQGGPGGYPPQHGGPGGYPPQQFGNQNIPPPVSHQQQQQAYQMNQPNGIQGGYQQPQQFVPPVHNTNNQPQLHHQGFQQPNSQHNANQDIPPQQHPDNSGSVHHQGVPDQGNVQRQPMGQQFQSPPPPQHIADQVSSHQSNLASEGVPSNQQASHLNEANSNFQAPNANVGYKANPKSR